MNQMTINRMRRGVFARAYSDDDGKYKHYLQHNCGWAVYVPWGQLYQIRTFICPDCGAEAPTDNSDLKQSKFSKWELFVGRYTDILTKKSVWWKFWQRDVWETKLERLEE
jgi:hypothetical protein